MEIGDTIKNIENGLKGFYAGNIKCSRTGYAPKVEEKVYTVNVLIPHPSLFEFAKDIIESRQVGIAQQVSFLTQFKCDILHQGILILSTRMLLVEKHKLRCFSQESP